MKTAKRIMLTLSITALLCCLLSVAAFGGCGGEHLDGGVRANQVGGQQGGFSRY